jgi:hypothetical protein
MTNAAGPRTGTRHPELLLFWIFRINRCSQPAVGAMGSSQVAQSVLFGRPSAQMTLNREINHRLRKRAVLGLAR